MGLRGPTTAPTALKLMRGNPGKRPLNKREPQPGTKIPRCPEHLDETARKEWKRLVPVLKRMRILTEADYIVLASLCAVYSRWIIAQTECNKLGLSGMIYKSKSGQIKINPYYTIVTMCAEQLTKLCREFGLTPSSRAGVQVLADGKDSDPWDLG